VQLRPTTHADVEALYTVFQAAIGDLWRLLDRAWGDRVARRMTITDAIQPACDLAPRSRTATSDGSSTSPRTAFDRTPDRVLAARGPADGLGACRRARPRTRSRSPRVLRIGGPPELLLVSRPHRPPDGLVLGSYTLL
jgi:hypothetical protein